VIGQTISHYLVEERVGKGGMGVVWRARDLNLNRPVAIKFINSEVADEDHRRRFQREALIASSLNHPNIVAVFEAGTHAGQQYIVTEYVDGDTLKNWAKRTKPSYRQMAELMIPVAEALACAHDAGIVHRDVKPENILVSRQGFAKLVDFGLAKLIEAQLGGESVTVTPTAPGHVLGTIPYMSPEHLSGRPVDRRTDLWSFGVALFEAIAGKRPHAAKGGAELIEEIVEGEPAPLSRYRADAPAELQRILDKALEKEPADRYQSAREIAVDLRRFARRAPEDSAEARAPKPWPWIAALGVSLAALAVVTLLWLRERRGAWVDPLEGATFTRLTDWEGSELDAAISTDGRTVAFLADRDGEFDVFAGPVGGLFVNLTRGAIAGLDEGEVPRVAFSADGAQVVVRARDGVFAIPARGGEPQRSTFPPATTSPISVGAGGKLVATDNRRGLTLGSEEYLSVAASTDGQRLVASVANPTAAIWSVPITAGLAGDQAARRLPVPDARSTAPRMGPDFLLYIGNGRLTRLRYGVVTLLATAVTQPASVSPDGRTVAYASAGDGRATLSVVSADGADPRRLAASIDVAGSVSWSPDGKWIAALGDAGQGARLWKIPVDRGAPEVLTSRDGRNPVWSPDGGMILFEERGALAAVTPAGAAVELPPVAVLGPGDVCRFVPGTRQLVLLLGEGRRRNFWLLDLATGQRRQITNLRGGYATRAFDVSRDGKEIIFDRLRENADLVLIERPSP
jgi:predicted Ser/Thr protein kinase